ncbi:MAG: radical SAM protein [Thermodesulfobacteriota bacterium]|nr:radical SAM protein [Thermodesulfobacteriota bacterium]
MRIVLVNPNPMKPPVTPVSLDYLGTACNAAGIDVDLVDCSVETEWSNKLSHFLTEKPILVGVTVRNIDDSYFASRDFSLRYIIPVLEEIKKLTEAPICLGGVGFSLFPYEVLEFCKVSYGIIGDGEESLVQLVTALRGKIELEAVPGLIWMENGIIRKNDILPVPLEKMDLSSRALIDNEYYLENGGQVGFETKRGCSLNCIYCPEPSTRGDNVRVRNPLNIVEELTCLSSRGITVFHTCDSEFNCPYSHAVLVSKAIMESGLGKKIKWYAYCTPEYFTEELASLMQQAGCVGIDFGADHGDDAMLRRLGHYYTSDDLTRIRETCLHKNIICMFDLLFGSPGETKESIEKTIVLMKKIKPDRVGISFGVRLYPTTQLGQKMMEASKGVLSNNPHLFGDLEDNESLLRPIYYCDAGLGDDVEEWLHALVGDDPRFLLGRRTDANRNYNYNDNSELTEAIKQGYRGAYWDILRRQSEGIPPLS